MEYHVKIVFSFDIWNSSTIGFYQRTKCSKNLQKFFILKKVSAMMKVKAIHITHAFDVLMNTLKGILKEMLRKIVSAKQRSE